MKRFSVAARIRGNRQYPSRHILWKKEMVPPKSYPLTAITAAPSQTMIKTISNKSVRSSACVLELNTLKGQLFRTYDASIRQKKNGPHKSQLRISLRFCSVSSFENGLITMRSFYQIRIKSLFFNLIKNDYRLTIVSITGSSKVFTCCWSCCD
jgi:hypothetical protein